PLSPIRPDTRQASADRSPLLTLLTHHHLSSPLFLSNAPAPPPLYPLSLHDALPISPRSRATSPPRHRSPSTIRASSPLRRSLSTDRKSTRLNSSHLGISYAVFCLKKKKQTSTA